MVFRQQVGVSAALLIALAVALPAQNRNRDRDADFGLPEESWCRQERRAGHCEVREETYSGMNVVDVDARPNGGILVRGWDRNDVHVRVRVAAYADTESVARSLASEVRLINDSGRIRVDGPPTRQTRRRSNRWEDGEYWTASFELQVPRRARLRLDSMNGGISVADFLGTAVVQTMNGGLSLSEVGGDFRGRTTNGGVSVSLSGERWDGAGLDIETTNGGVSMRVPSGFSAELDARTSNGGISVDLPVRVQGLLTRNKHVTATLGSGGAPLRLSTVNGGVSIARR